MTKWDFLFRLFEIMSASLVQQIEQFKTEIKESLMAVNEDLASVKATLEANNAIISEIAGDVQEVKTQNDQQLAKIAELEAKIPNEPLVAQIRALGEAQKTTLQSVAAMVPEPVEPDPAP